MKSAGKGETSTVMLGESINEGKPDGRVLKALAANLEFDPGDVHGGRREPSLESCPLTSTSAPWQSCAQALRINKIK